MEAYLKRTTTLRRYIVPRYCVRQGPPGAMCPHSALGPMRAVLIATTAVL